MFLRPEGSLLKLGACVSVVLLLVLLASACGIDGPYATAPAGPTERPSLPPTHTAEVGDAGELQVSFVAFHPARASQMSVGGGAWVELDYSITRADLALEFEVLGATDVNGTRPFETSFWTADRKVAFVCGAGPGPTHSAGLVAGFQRSQTETYPQQGEPDVPFVRLRVWATPFARACEPPDTFTIESDKPVMVVVERLNWRAP